MRVLSKSIHYPNLILAENRQDGLKRSVSSLQRMNLLFAKEKRRQREAVGRIEKIEVAVHAPAHQVKVEVNKSLSTPYDCARHIDEHVTKTSVLALINDTEPWDMHRPLEDDCAIHLKTCLDPEPQLLNQAFWRTCSFLLASVAQRAFKENVAVIPHSFPRPNVLSGSFVSFIELGVADWKPSDFELRRLSKEMATIAEEHHFLERLVVSRDLAEEIFSDNPHKTKQIPSIANKCLNEKITLYRAGDHIDISGGPMISHTGQIGRCSVTAVQPVPEMGKFMYRFQGVALFKQLYLNHFAFKVLEDRASQPNAGPVAIH